MDERRTGGDPDPHSLVLVSVLPVLTDDVGSAVTVEVTGRKGNELVVDAADSIAAPVDGRSERRSGRQRDQKVTGKKIEQVHVELAVTVEIAEAAPAALRREPRHRGPEACAAPQPNVEVPCPFAHQIVPAISIEI